MNLYFLMFQCVVFYFINVFHFVSSSYPKVAQFCLGNVPCAECGICRRDSDISGDEICDKSFFVTPGDDSDDIFTSTCKTRNMCSPQTCINDVSCEPLFGSLNCTCKPDYYGLGCTNEIEPLPPKTDYASGISIMFAPFCESMDVSFMLVVIENPGKNLEVEFDNGMGLTSIQTIHAAQVGNVTKFCLECGVAPFRLCLFLAEKFAQDATVFIFESKYPINKQLDENLIQNFTHFQYTEGRKYQLGVKVTSNLKIQGWKSEQFSDTIQKIIWYKNKKGQSCLPLLDLSQCSKDGKTIPSIYRPGTMKFEATITPGLQNCTYETFRLKWLIWRNIHNFDESDEPLRKFTFADNVYSYRLKPYALEDNKYVIKLVGEMTINQYKKLFNFMYCFFNVDILNIVAVIDGGNTRSAHFNNDIVLDVSRSVDPNEPMGKQKEDLRYSWRCEPVINDAVCDGTKRPDTNYVIHGPFMPGQAYTFTLTASAYNKSERIDTQVIQIVQMVQAKIGALLVRCLKNCGGRGFNSTTHEIVYLEAIYQGGLSITPGVELRWTYFNGSTGEDITPVRQSETPSHILIVDEEKMTKHSFYKFTVYGQGEEMAQYNIFTSSDPKPGSCSIDPTEGVMGVTKFKIVCIDFASLQKDHILYFEFYDNKPDQPGLGVYMGVTSTGVLKDVTLVGGIITIHIMDSLRMFVTESVTATITNYTFEQVEISDMVRDLVKFEKGGNKMGLMRTIAVLAETANYTQNKEEEMLESLDVLTRMRGTDDNTLKLLGSGLSNYLQAMLANEEDGLGSHSTQLAGYIMEYVGRSFKSVYTNVIKEENEIESRTIRQIAMYLAECAEQLFKTKNETIRNYSVMTYEQQNVVTQYKEGLVSMVHALDMAAAAGGFHLMPYQRIFSTVSSTIFIWARLSAETKEMTEFIAGKPYLDVRFSQELAEEVDKRPGSLILEVVTMKKNPFWWYRGCYNEVESTIASFKLRKKHLTTKKTINKLKHPLFIYLNLSTIETKPVTGTTYLPNSDDDFDTKNAAVAIHRIETPIGAKLFLKFYNQSESLKVVVLKNMIPDYDYMEELGIRINEEKPLYDVQDMLTNIDSFFYLGVLPDNSGETGKNVSFSFEVITANCMTWHTTILGRRCDVVLDSTLERLHCSCGHLSIITGSKIPAPSLVNYESNLKFSMKLETNILLFICILSLFLLYGLILLWAMFKERKDKVKELVVLLDDNYPGDDYGYLIAVYTGSRILAGTNANVGVRLFGNIQKSRAHILRSSKHKTMQRYDDDWFLLFTPHHLGELHHIHVWHDNTGRFPDWFCDKIIVYDLEAQVEYIFPVDQWLAGKKKQFLEVYMAPVQKKDFETQSNLTLENIVLGFRETHVWASIGNRHPRTTMTRIDRAAVCMCFVMLSLLITSVYYYVFEGSEDDPFFKISIRELLIVIVSTIIIAPIMYLILLLFRLGGVKKKNKKDNKPEEKDDIQLEENNVETERYHVHAFKSKATMNEAKNVDPSINTETGNKNKQNLFKYILLRPVWLAPLDGSKEEKRTKTSRNLIPCIICQAVIVVCAIGVIVLGMKLGKFKTEKWLMTAGFVVFQDICIFLPVKILIFAFLLGYYRRKLFYVDTYDFNYEEAKRKHLIGDNDYLFDLEKLRTKPMYHPLSRADVIVLHTKRHRRYGWAEFLEFIIVLLFLILIFFLINDMYTARYYHTNDQIRKALIYRTVNGTVNFEEVNTKKRFFDYLSFTFFHNVYKGLDVNNVLKSDFETTKFGRTGWFVDDVHRLVGIPRLRQLRVLKDKCTVPNVIKKADSGYGCVPPLNYFTEETRNYKFAWNEDSWHDLDYDEEPDPSPWVYVPPGNSKSAGFYGHKFAWNEDSWHDLDYDEEPYPSPWVYVPPGKSKSAGFYGHKFVWNEDSWHDLDYDEEPYPSPWVYVPPGNSKSAGFYGHKFVWNEDSWHDLDYDEEPYPSPWVYVPPGNSKSAGFYGHKFVWNEDSWHDLDYDEEPYAFPWVYVPPGKSKLAGFYGHKFVWNEDSWHDLDYDEEPYPSPWVYVPPGKSKSAGFYGHKFVWNEDSWLDLDYDEEPYPFPWVYVPPGKSKLAGFYGKSGTKYDDGGYMVYLGRTNRETNYTLAETLYSNWIDHNTRVIIVELQLYAVNSKTFSLVSVVVELLPGDTFLRRIEVVTVHVKKEWFYWTIIFSFLTAFFLWSNIYKLNEYGIFNFITHFWDYFEIIILLVCIINLGLHIYHIFYIENTIHAHHIVGKDEFLSYAVMLKELRLIALFSYILVVCLTIRLLKTFKFGRSIIVFCYTLMFTARSVLCITILFIMFLLIISMLISCILNAPFTNTYRLYFMFKTGYHNLRTNSVYPHKRIILVIYCLSASLFSCIFVILYSYYIRIAKSHKLLKPQRLNYLTFFKEQLGLTDKHEYISRRLRGGLDATTPRLSKSNEMLMSLRTKQYIKYLISQNENTKKGYLQAVHFFKELPLEFSFGYEKLIDEFLKYEKNRNQDFKFISNFNFNLTCVVSKIDDILSDERE